MKQEGSSLSVDHRMDGETIWLHLDQMLISASLLFVSNPGNQKCNLLGLRGERRLGFEDYRTQYFSN